VLLNKEADKTLAPTHILQWFTKFWTYWTLEVSSYNKKIKYVYPETESTGASGIGAVYFVKVYRWE